MKHLESRSFGATSNDAGNAIYLCKTPLLYALIDDVMDLLCVATGHRYCNSWLMHWTFSLALRHTDRLVLPASDSEVIRLHEWMGWDPPFWTYDDEDA